jgi:hypothetical protein
MLKEFGATLAKGGFFVGLTGISYLFLERIARTIKTA